MKTLPRFRVATLALLLALAGCKDGSESKKAAEAREYDVRGKVVAVDPAEPAVTLDHEDIPGLMKGMEMEIRVQDPKLLEGIKVGDQVQARLKRDKSGHILTHLEKRTGQ